MTMKEMTMFSKCALAVSLGLAGMLLPTAGAQTPPRTQATTASTSNAPGMPLSAEKVAALLPPSVYFQGKSAPIQLRNAAAVDFGSGDLVWAALVDTSGYSTAVQDRYQFFFVTESSLHFGTALLPAGAYGGGFLGDHFLVMDVGGHTLAQGPLQMDEGMHRPRPLEMVADTPHSVRLYLGRHWVLLQQAPAAPVSAQQ